MIKITVAIPVYNVEKYIEASLLSALNQTYSNIEYVIVDDKGPDNSMDIVRRIKQTHPRGKDIKIVEHPKNIGTGGARNSSMDNATGDYIFFMDSDDTIEPDTIKILVDNIPNEGVDVLEASYRMLTNEGKLVKDVVFGEKYLRGNMAICEWMRQTKLYYDGFPWNRLISLKFLKANSVRCIPSHRNEDVLFSFQVVLYAKSYITLPKITYNYFMRPGSTVHQKVNDYYYNQYLEIFDARTTLIKKIPVTPPRILYNYYLQHFFEWRLYQSLGSTFSKEKKKYFYKEIQKIHKLGFGVWDMIGIRYKLMYLFLFFNNYLPYLYLCKVDKRCNRIYDLLRKYGLCKLPYSHM